MDFDFFTTVYWINLHKYLINFGQKSKNPFSIRFWTEIRPCQGRTSVQNHFQNWFLIFLPKFCILYPIFQSFLRWLFFEVYEKAILDRNPARARAGFRSRIWLKMDFCISDRSLSNVCVGLFSTPLWKNQNPFSIRFWTEIRPWEGRISVQNTEKHQNRFFPSDISKSWPKIHAILHSEFLKLDSNLDLDRNPALIVY